MARPSNRRPGHSRRAQYGLFIGYVVTVSGAVVALLLLILSAVDPQGFGAFKGAVSDTTMPIASAGRSIVSGVGSVGETMASYIDAASKVRRLEAEAQVNATRLIQARATAFENERLKRLLGLKEQGIEPVTVGRLIGSTGSSIRRYAILDAGYIHGVRGGMPVRGPYGLIGRIANAGAISARVALITDGGTVIPVRRAQDGLPAIATGTGDGEIDIRTLGAEASPFKRGDVLVTSGTGGVYHPNIPVAVVSRVTRETTYARPIADASRFDFAMVEPVYQPAVEEQRLALPPPPAQ
jgi:rod shape-determining protein MreC